MEKEEQKKNILELSEQIMELACHTLMVKWHFLDMALSRFSFIPSEETQAFYTDGKEIFYAPRKVLLLYKADRNAPARAILHITLHLIEQHSFVGKKIDRLRWDTACDIAVENTLDEMKIGGILPSMQREHDNTIAMLKRKIKVLTAERIYHFLFENKYTEKELYELRAPFCIDEHGSWYKNETEEENGENKGWQAKEFQGQNSESPNGMNGETGRSGRSTSGQGDRESDSGKGRSESGSGRLRNMNGNSETDGEWKNIAERIEENLETFSKTAGSAVGSLLYNLHEAGREHCDYAEFLKKFAVRGEEMKTSEDEFDYVFYTYGLELYGNLPLIEPLEYRDTKRIREFVIAIDTSGSCSGELVKQFIRKTYNILQSTESFFSKISVHIVQCDTEVRKDDLLTSKEDFEHYMENVRIYGGGGTDFRPVFRYVDELIDKKELRDLKGILYFTDGIGVFPEQKPPYETAFVFIRDDEDAPPVPPWAIRLILPKSELREEEEQ